MTDHSSSEPTASATNASALSEYASELLTMRLDRMLAQAEGVRESKEIEPIHQMRVWSRRSRAALEVFRPCFDGKEYTAIVMEVKKVTRTLGAARDLDVMIDTLSRREEDLPPEQRAGLESFIATLRRDRRNLQRDVESAMEHLERFYLRDRFAALVARRRRAGFPTKHSAKTKSAVALNPKESLLVNAARIIGARLDAILAYDTIIYDPDEVYELHQMRIAAKQLRYTLEMFEEKVKELTGFGAEYTAAIETVRGLQEHLGEIHDADVLVPRLLEYLTHLAAAGFGVHKDGEPIAGVHLVDFDACEGLLVLCREARETRDRRYRRLVRDWERIGEAGTFVSLRALLQEAALSPPETTPPAPLVAALTLPEETQHGEDNHQAVESLPAAPRRRGGRRPAPAPLGHSEPGADPVASPSKSGV